MVDEVMIVGRTALGRNRCLTKGNVQKPVQKIEKVFFKRFLGPSPFRHKTSKRQNGFGFGTSIDFSV